MFRSIHSLSSVNFASILAKHEVPASQIRSSEPISPPLFDWTEAAAFGTELRKEVKAYFQAANLSPKANPAYYLSVAFVVSLFCCIAWYWTISSSLLCAFIAGILAMTLGFFVMHSASHGAIAHSPLINYSFTVIWCSTFWWNHILWLQHHVFGHHSFTGIYGKDPDLRNMHPFVRKHPKDRSKPLTKRFQHFVALLVMLVIPNQFIGQFIAYIQAFYRGKLFGMPLTYYVASVLEWVYPWFGLVSFYFLMVQPVFTHGWEHVKSCGGFIFGIGLTYWAIVFPNHDTEGVLIQAEETEKRSTDNKKTKTDGDVEEKQPSPLLTSSSEEKSGLSELFRDWAALQLIHTSNFELPNWLSQVIGGMNYQIEHHLFPSVHPIHYPAISRIVRRLAKKYGLPYLSYKSWFHSLFAHVRLLKVLGKPCKTD